MLEPSKCTLDYDLSWWDHLIYLPFNHFLDKEHKYRIGTGLFCLVYVSFYLGSYL